MLHLASINIASINIDSFYFDIRKAGSKLSLYSNTIRYSFLPFNLTDVCSIDRKH